MMYYYNDFYPLHLFGFGHIFMFLFWAGIIYGAFLLFKHKGPKHSHEDHAIKILKERYEKGEITKEKFDNIKKDLQ